MARKKGLVKEGNRKYYPFTAAQDARIMAAYERKAEMIKDLAAEFGVVRCTVRVRYDKLRGASEEAPKISEVARVPSLDEHLYLRRVPAWLRGPVEKVVENPVTT